MVWTKWKIFSGKHRGWTHPCPLGSKSTLFTGQNRDDTFGSFFAGSIAHFTFKWNCTCFNGQAVSSSTRLHESCQNSIGPVFCPFVALGTIEYVRIRMNHRGIRWRRRNWRKRPGQDLIEGEVFWHRNLDGHPKKGHLRFSARVAARAGSHGLSRCVRHLWLAKNWKKQIQNLTSFWFRQRDFDYKSADVRSSNS